MWEHLGAAFVHAFPGSDNAVEREFYLPWQTDAMRTYAERILIKHDSGEELLLVGHSMGGVIACAIAPRFAHSKVRGIVTIFSPHMYLGGHFSRALGAGKVRIPLISFEAAWDAWVPYGTRHPQSREHTLLETDHVFGLIRNAAWATQIAGVAKRHFSDVQ